VKPTPLLSVAAKCLICDEQPKCCDRQVLEKDGGNVKALYRRAQGHLALADYVETEVTLLDTSVGSSQDVERSLSTQKQNQHSSTTFLAMTTQRSSASN